MHGKSAATSKVETSALIRIMVAGESGRRTMLPDLADGWGARIRVRPISKGLHLRENLRQCGGLNGPLGWITTPRNPDRLLNVAPNPGRLETIGEPQPEVRGRRCNGTE